MLHPKGRTINLTFAYQRIEKVILSLNGECFTQKEICKITGLNRPVVSVFLMEKTKKGFLERVRFGCYRKILDGNLTNRMPSAFVATKVWEILNKSDKPLVLREVSQIITENTGFNLYRTVSSLFSNWCRRDVLDKFGSKQPYAYQIKPDYNLGRPSAGKLF